MPFCFPCLIAKIALFSVLSISTKQKIAVNDKKPALNPDLWETLLALTQKHELHYHWVKGHADNPKNNRCDELAVSEWKKRKP